MTGVPQTCRAVHGTAHNRRINYQDTKTASCVKRCDLIVQRSARPVRRHSFHSQTPCRDTGNPHGESGTEELPAETAHGPHPVTVEETLATDNSDRERACGARFPVRSIYPVRLGCVPPICVALRQHRRYLKRQPATHGGSSPGRSGAPPVGTSVQSESGSPDPCSRPAEAEAGSPRTPADYRPDSGSPQSTPLRR